MDHDLGFLVQGYYQKGKPRRLLAQPRRAWTSMT